MSRRLVIPAGQTGSNTAAAIGRAQTWAEVAAENGLDTVEPLGSEWCTANGIDGLGIATEAPSTPSAAAPGPLAGVTLDPDLVAVAEAAIDAAVTNLAAALDPQTANPTTASRLAALETLLTVLIEQVRA